VSYGKSKLDKILLFKSGGTDLERLAFELGGTSFEANIDRFTSLGLVIEHWECTCNVWETFYGRVRSTALKNYGSSIGEGQKVRWNL
jgi:hypothetical protein